MPFQSKQIIVAGTVAALVALGSVSVAFSNVDPRDTPIAAQPRGFETEGAGRPMDDLGPDIPFGDLSVFDALTEIGEAQSVDVPYCDIRATLLRTLDHDFAEHPRLRSPLDARRSVELWASEVMGTWTAVYTRADGVSCVVSSGIGWQQGNDPLALLQSEGLLPAG